MAVDYAKLLETKYQDLPQKRLLPNGSWFFKALSAKFEAPKEEGKSATIMIVFQAKEPGDDVDETELQELMAGDYDLSANKIFHRIWIQDATDFRKAGAILEKLGIDVASMSLKEALESVKNNDVIGYVTKRSYKGRSGEDETENVISEFAQVE